MYPEVRIALNTSEDNLVTELYTPCFKWAERFDRGIGFFTSGWIAKNICGLSDFVSRGGRIRLITSPIISNEDLQAIETANEEESKYKVFYSAIRKGISALASEMEKDILNSFAWMIHDGIIDLKFAVPVKKLVDGDFHDKFGIFYNGKEALSFVGSINDSIHGFQNYESIKIFKTWSGTGEYVQTDIDRFERIWNSQDKNLAIYTTPQAIKDEIFELRTGTRPYKSTNDNKWKHQDEAVAKFLEAKNGILAMATGTGKTMTAVKIMRILFGSCIKRAVVTVAGNDLLDQWASKLRKEFPEMPKYLHYGPYKEISSFIMHPDNSIMVISNDSDSLVKLLKLAEKQPIDLLSDTLWVFDEVHDIGSSSRVESLSGKISRYVYRLGLSATPEREFDEEGNKFIEEEIGSIIYEFSIEDAIKRNILCPFDYTAIDYELSEEEKNKKRSIIAFFENKKKNGELVSDYDIYTQLARVNKTAEDKLKGFEDTVSRNPSILNNCIIFVETREFGEKVQNIILKYTYKYHTYYGDDDKSNLVKFANGDLDCLVTCKKISEGIDINRVSSIVLFSSDRSKLVTTQRIGRALRVDPKNSQKIAKVLDFVLKTENEGDETADNQRKKWLNSLSKIRSDINEE